MPKKSFKDNPALQFISSTEPEPQPVEQLADQPETPPRATEKPPAGYKMDPRFVEVKSRRLQLVLQPSLYERVKAKAAAAGISVNEYVHQILAAATREE